MGLPNLTVLSALSKAYTSTSNTEYIERTETVKYSLDKLKRKNGCINQEEEEILYLSIQALATMALLDLFKATGEKKHLNEACRNIDFTIKKFYGNSVFCHHWSKKRGKTGWYCVGCNFYELHNTLIVIDFLTKNSTSSFISRGTTPL